MQKGLQISTTTETPGPDVNTAFSGNIVAHTIIIEQKTAISMIVIIAALLIALISVVVVQGIYIHKYRRDKSKEKDIGAG